MIFDTPEQKNYVTECIRKFPCNYEQALQYANAFGQAIQDGQVIAVVEQNKAFPPPKPLVPAKAIPVPATNRGNGAAPPDPVAETCQEETDADGQPNPPDPETPDKAQGKK